MQRWSRIAATTSIGALAGIASGQQVQWSVPGEQRAEQFGYSSCRVPDRDGDGVDELLVGAPAWNSGEETGHARLLSGASFGLLLELDGGPLTDLDVADRFGAAVASLGDFDGDGLDDFLVSAPSRGVVEVRAGSDGRLLRDYERQGHWFGAALVALGDLDSDGVPDFAASVPTELAPWYLGAVRVLSGGSGALIVRHGAQDSNSRIASRNGMALAPDRDGDGLPELLLIDRFWDSGSGASRPGVRMVSAASSAEHLRIPFPATTLPLHDAFSAASIDDLDGDGLAEVLVGAIPIAAGQPALAIVFSGATGAELFRAAANLDATRAIVAAAGDHDGDGLGDLLIACDGASSSSAPRASVRLLAGASGLPLSEVVAPLGSVAWGSTLLARLDLDQDGVEDLVVADPDIDESSGFREGLLEAYDFTGTLLRRRSGDACDCPVELPSALLGDIDGDGAADVALARGLGDPAGSTVVLRSGRDGSTLRLDATPNFPTRGLAALPDLDGDGVLDYAVGMDDRVELRSAATGALIRSCFAPLAGGRFGEVLAVAIQPGGVVELAVGAPGSNAAFLGAGEVVLFDVATGAPKFRVLGRMIHEEYGSAIVHAGDLDGDGIGDWAVGAPRNSSNSPDAGRVECISGVAGAQLKVLRGTAADEWAGAAVASIADRDGDGLRDLAIGASRVGLNDEGAVRLYSSGTFALLATYSGDQRDGYYGRTLASVQDVNRDGIDDWCVGGLPGELRCGATGGRLARVRNAIVDASAELVLHVAAPFVTGSPSGDAIADVLVVDPAYPRWGGVQLVALDEVMLTITPIHSLVGETVGALLAGGPPGNPGLLHLSAIDGVPVSVVLVFASFDALGELEVEEVVPPSLAGFTWSLNGFAIGHSGALTMTPAQTIGFH